MSDSKINDIQHLGSIDGTQIAVVASWLEQRTLVYQGEFEQRLVRLSQAL